MLKLPDYLDKAQVDVLIEYAPNDSAELLFLLQWRAGLRISEALNLRYADITMSNDMPTLRVRAGKGGKDRLVPLHPDLKNRLRWAPRSRRKAQEPLFSITRQTGWNWIKRAYLNAQRAARLPPGLIIKTHTLRHSFARHCIAQGVPINQVQIWLGHSHLTTTMIYSQLVPDAEGKMQTVE